MENDELLARIERLEKLLLEMRMERLEKLTLQNQDEGEVRTKRLVLVDENGRTCCILTARSDGERGFSVSDQDGEPRLELRAAREDTVLVLMNPASESFVAIRAVEEDAYLELRNANGERGVAMMATADKGGHLTVCDKNDDPKVTLQAHTDGGMVIVSGDGDAEAILSVGAKMKGLFLVGQDGEPLESFVARP